MTAGAKLAILAVAISSLSCQSALVFLIENETGDPLDVTLVVETRFSNDEPRGVRFNYVSLSDVDRWFGEPELLPADQPHYDAETGRFLVTVPPRMALRVVFYAGEYGPLTYLELSGVVGTVRLTSQQAYLHFEDRRAGPTLVYRSAYSAR